MSQSLLLGVGIITLCLASSASLPAPSPDVLAWTKQEIGAMFSFDMITMLTNISDTQYFCIGVGGGGGWLPTPDFFDPEDLDLDNWVLAAASFGAKYAVLTAQHCSGFSLWPTDIYKATGFNYTYSTTSSPFRGGGYDLVGAFVAACNKRGILPGIYYSLNQNYYLNVAGGKVLNTRLVPGQAGNVTQELYGEIVLAQLEELWTNYGELAEIWFDGDCKTVPGISQQIAQLQATLQPHAIAFQGCSSLNNIRWVGTESGKPGYPLWSTSQNCAYGQGSPTGNVFCPAETDTVLAAFDMWFWRSGVPLRSLADLQQVYYDSVGQNTNLLLNIAPNRTGTVDFEAADLYEQYGSWIAGCFSQPLLQASGEGTAFYLSSDTPVTFNHVVISEDQTYGEAVTEFFVAATLSDGIVNVLSGQSVGNKFVRPVQPVTTTNVMLTITSSLSSPNITRFAVYNC